MPLNESDAACITDGGGCITLRRCWDKMGTIVKFVILAVLAALGAGAFEATAAVYELQLQIQTTAPVEAKLKASSNFCGAEGEVVYRAVEKRELSEAEAVADLIAAQTAAEPTQTPTIAVPCCHGSDRTAPNAVPIWSAVSPEKAPSAVLRK